MRFNKGAIAAAVVVVITMATPAQAQRPARGGGRTAAWTAVGAGAGFGIGLWAGLTAFDDAIDSDRKVWTSAIVGAAAGGTLAYLLSRARRQPSPIRTSAGAAVRAKRPALTERDITMLAASARLFPGTISHHARR